MIKKPEKKIISFRIQMILGMVMFLILGLTFMYAIVSTVVRDILVEIKPYYTPNYEIYEALTPILIAFSLFIIILFLIVSLFVFRMLSKLEEKTKSESRMRLMYDNMPISAIVLDKNSNILHCNTETLRLFNVSNRNKFSNVAKNFSPKYQPDGTLTSDLWERLYNEAFEKGYTQHEFTYVLNNGEVLPAELTLIQTDLMGGEYLLVFVRDLRDMFKNLETKKESYELTQIMLNSMPLITQLWGENCQPIDCNKATLDFYRVSNKEDYIKKLSNELNIPGISAGYKSWKNFINAVFNNGFGEVEVDYIINPKTREQTYMKVTGVRVEYNNAPIVITYANNVTELKRMKKHMNDAIVENNAKSAFISNMGHELRTPINSIVSLSVLANKSNVAPKLESYLEQITDSAHWVLQILNDILDISNIESGRVNLESVPFDFADILSKCRTITLPKAIEKGLTLHFYTEPLDENKLLIGDPVRLRQIFTHIISNAITYTDVGIVRVTVEVKKVRKNRISMYCEIKDSGVGLSTSQIDHIMEPLSKSDAKSARKFGGANLGLAIVKNFLALMGSKMKIESTLGTGTKISFNLTFATVDKEQLEDKPHFEGEVLVCDDNEVNQLIISENLYLLGLKPTIAENGKVAVNMVENRKENGRPFDLILMDISMPIMDGLDAASIILEIEPHAQIVAMTANIMESDQEIYRKHGMKDYLGKPFLTEELWNVLHRYFDDINASIDSSLK